MLIKGKIVRIVSMQKQRLDLIEMFVVSLGGGIGGSLRYLLRFLRIVGQWPLMTILINWLGTLLLAILGSYLSHRSSRLKRWQAFLGTGILGGFTTFSTMLLQTAQLTQSNIVMAGLYLVMTVVGGVLMIILGQYIGHVLCGERL